MHNPKLSSPRVTIIVPIYKVAPYIRKCLLSLAQQTSDDFEVLLINDATPDDSMLAARRASKSLPNVREINLGQNSGLSAARNAGLDAARGEYILFLDSDDWLAPTAVEDLLNASRSVADIVVMDYYRARANGTLSQAKYRKPYSCSSLGIFDPAEHQDVLHILNLAQIKMCRLAFLKENRFRFTEGVIYEDLDWTFKLLTTSTKVAVVDRPLYFYRSARPGSILNTKGSQHFDVIGQCERVFAFLRANGKDHFLAHTYNYLINSVYSVLIESARIPVGRETEFFRQAQAVFSKARGEEKFQVTLFDRGWFESILLTGTYEDAVAAKAARDRARRRTAYKIVVGYAKRTWSRHVRRMQERGVELLHKLPKRDVVFFESYWGEQYADSPRYVYEHLRRNHPHITCRYSLKRTVESSIEKGCRVSWNSILYHFHLATAKVVVNNNNFHSLYKKRAGTTFIQTFHGIPIKHIGTDMIGFEDGKGTNWNALVRRCANWDFFISAGEHHTETLRSAFHSSAEFLEIGSPRTDPLYDPAYVSSARMEVRQRLAIPPESFLVLYAPTWREGEARYLSSEELASFADALGSDCHVAVRHHHYGHGTTVGGVGRLHDLTTHPDGQQLCAAADMLITDYSSIAFDFACIEKPVAFYVPDLEQYAAKRGLYFDVRTEAPALTASCLEELLRVATQLRRQTELCTQAIKTFRSRYCEGERSSTSEIVVNELILPALGAKSCRIPRGKELTKLGQFREDSVVT